MSESFPVFNPWWAMWPKHLANILTECVEIEEVHMKNNEALASQGSSGAPSN
jgi:hypothetical protein